VASPEDPDGTELQLAVTTMALYRYVPGKEELVDLMMDAAIGTPSSPIGRAEDWRTGLAQWQETTSRFFNGTPGCSS
jgi:AcrR family transcriptional regulator